LNFIFLLFSVPASASSLSATPTTGTPGAIPSGTAVPSANVNFRQLQEQINKWTIDIEEQERDFIEQATKVNYWDKVLMANGDKVRTFAGS
jgi:nuclear pore complex protein Nup62